ncbi:DUF1659 domain-containing protein [Virgibacillus sp. W0181]|uniref:DUF1659 domain-containing protein n=1 Tax=Virgibacillus sp. W0181 TaxID=3391581 RepID=UPI003F450A2F
MAVADLMNSQLRLILDDGEDMFTGETIYKTKSFNNVKTSATADQLYTVATAMTDLQERPLYQLQRKDSSDIREA